MTKVAIHQSQYIPWPPYFRKIAQADVFVILDKVQFQKNGVQNRNRIRNKERDFWLTIPVTGQLNDLISDKKLSDSRWNKKHWNALQLAYAKAPFWHQFNQGIENLFHQEYAVLGEVNDCFLRYLLDVLQISTKVFRLSELALDGTKSDLLLSICKHFGATVYVSGLGGKAYLKEDTFRQSGIAIEYLESVSPVYSQFYGDFIQGLSILDMMFNVNLTEINKYLGGKN